MRPFPLFPDTAPGFYGTVPPDATNAERVDAAAECAALILEAVRPRRPHERPMDRRRVLMTAIERTSRLNGRVGLVMPVDLGRLTLDQIETLCGWLVTAAGE